MRLLFAIVLFAVIESLVAQQCSNVFDKKRIDCFPDKGANEGGCQQRGCCWRKPDIEDGDIPYCYYPSDYTGYKISKALIGPPNTTFELRRLRPSGLPNDINLVQLQLNKITDNLLQIKLIDPQKKRFEPKLPVLNVPQTLIQNPTYETHINSDGNLIVTRKTTGQTIFTVDISTLIYSDQFLQLTSTLPSNFVYGLGEHKDHFQKTVNWKRYTFFNKDNVPTPNTPLYGSHPFYFTIEPNSSYSSGVFLFNSNAMDIMLSPSPAITYRPIGGILDFYIFVEETPADVVSEYIKLVGLPIMPPLWTLGFHLSRYGYNSLSNMVAAWNRTRNALIPLDVQWSDIDYMQDYNDFTYDKVEWAGLPQFVDKLHQIGMHYVIILDPGVSAGEAPNTYPPYDDGVKMDIFIKHANGQTLIGKVWNKSGKTVFPDFTHPNATEYWTKQAQRFYAEVKYDGLWIDMNEISNFLDGSDIGCPDSPLETPPYEPGYMVLRHKSVCMTAKTYAGDYYNTHNLYSTYESLATNKALRKIRIGKRPFLLSRSTFSGQGKYGTHWTGDVASNWDDLKYSIPSILDFNVFGIPFVGADICGFRDDTSEELCARWMAVGAFYPFSRNHNTKDTRDQDPAILGADVVSASKKALSIRYSLIPYLYTLFYRANNFGETVARPLMLNFPEDEETYDIESQFMWGSHIMIAPVLEAGARSIDSYFPAGRWWSWNTTRMLYSKGEQFNLYTPIDEINVYVKEGAIIPFSDPVLMTRDLHDSNFNLLVTLDEKHEAKGELFWDDGDSIDSQESEKYNLIQFEARNGTVYSRPIKIGYKVHKYVTSIIVCGVKRAPTAVYVNQKKVNFNFNRNSMCLKANLNGSLNIFTKFKLNWN